MNKKNINIKTELSIFPKRKFEMHTTLDGIDITSENIFNLLQSYSELEQNKLTISNMYDLSYKKPFALYNINTRSKNRSPYNLIGYSYGTKYNRSNENSPLIPKHFFLDINNQILEAKLYKDSVIIQFVTQKELGRDSYYITYGDSEYFINGDGKDIIKEILGNKDLYLGSSYFKFKTDELGFDDQMKLARITETFFHITGFHQQYAYITFQKISLNDILNNTIQLFDVRQKKAIKPIEINDIDQIIGDWEKLGNILPVKPE